MIILGVLWGLPANSDEGNDDLTLPKGKLSLQSPKLPPPQCNSYNFFALNVDAECVVATGYDRGSVERHSVGQ